MSWIRIEEIDRSPSGKTRRWEVFPMQGIGLLVGRITWYPQWRKYCFLPMTNTVFEEDCLRELADFCAARTKEHKSGKLQTH